MLYERKSSIIMNFLKNGNKKYNYFQNYLVNNVSVSFNLYEKCMIGSKLLSKQTISERIVNENDRIILGENIYIYDNVILFVMKKYIVCKTNNARYSYICGNY